jgi:hypothetical protein
VLNAPVEAVPLIGLLPLQPVAPPLAVQDVAPLELQESVAEPPEAIAEGFAVSTTCTAFGVTLTVVLALAEPPEPEQVSVNLVVAFSAPVEPEPLAPLEPLQLPPDPVHEVASVELQVSVELPPPETVVGEALNDTVGAGVVVDPLLLPPPPQPASVSAAAMLPAISGNLMPGRKGKVTVETVSGDALSLFIG